MDAKRRFLVVWTPVWTPEMGEQKIQTAKLERNDKATIDRCCRLRK